MATQYTPEEALGGMRIFSKAVAQVKNTMFREFEKGNGVPGGESIESSFIKRLDEQLITSQLPHIGERDAEKLARAKQEYTAALALFSEATDRHTAMQKGEKNLPGGTARFDDIFKELKAAYPKAPKIPAPAVEKIELPPALPPLLTEPQPLSTPAKKASGR